MARASTTPLEKQVFEAVFNNNRMEAAPGRWLFHRRALDKLIKHSLDGEWSPHQFPNREVVMNSFRAAFFQIWRAFFQHAPAAVHLFACLSLLSAGLSFNRYVSRKISGNSPDFMDINFFQFEFSPDCQYAVFIADRDTDEKFELYSVPVAGSAPTRISGAKVPAGGYGRDRVRHLQRHPRVARRGRPPDGRARGRDPARLPGPIQPEPTDCPGSVQEPF